MNIVQQVIVNSIPQKEERSGGFPFRLILSLLALAGIGIGLYWLASIALELLAALAESVADLVGGLVTALLDVVVAVGHVVTAYAPTALWAVGYTCLALVGLSVVRGIYEQWTDRQESCDVVVSARPVKPQHVLIVVADKAQAQEAVKLLPESASYEFIEMPVAKESVYHER